MLTHGCTITRKIRHWAPIWVHWRRRTTWKCCSRVTVDFRAVRRRVEDAEIKVRNLFPFFYFGSVVLDLLAEINLSHLSGCQVVGQPPSEWPLVFVFISRPHLVVRVDDLSVELKDGGAGRLCLRDCCEYLRSCACCNGTCADFVLLASRRDRLSRRHKKERPAREASRPEWSWESGESASSSGSSTWSAESTCSASCSSQVACTCVCAVPRQSLRERSSVAVKAL